MKAWLLFHAEAALAVEAAEEDALDVDLSGDSKVNIESEVVHANSPRAGSPALRVQTLPLRSI